MPKFLTNKEKQQRYIENLKRTGRYQEYQHKKALAMKKSREKKKEQEKGLPKREKKMLEKERKEATRQRVAKHRRMKKEQAQKSASAGPFNSAMAFAKATARARRMLDPSLPSTPRRRVAVCRKLYEAESRQGADVPSTSAEKNKPGPARQLGDGDVKVIHEFYERDDVSYQAPGKKDVVTMWNDGDKKKVQARYLTSSVKETHAFFREEHPDIEVGFSKFAEYCPKHILLSHKIPHNVCLCKIHENAINVFSALHKSVPAFPPYTRELPASFLCTDPSRECWLNECEKCREGAGFEKNFKAVFEECMNSPSSWSQWESGDDGRMKKILEEGTVGELLHHAMTILPQFLKHCYVKREQAAVYNEHRKKAPESDVHHAVLQVDFSENYTCQAQDEIQSAHWNQHQVSLFTAALWHSGSLFSHVLASDNLCHSKDTIVAYLDVLLDFLPDQVTHVSIWSDGPASQFKNRYIAAAFASLEKAHKVHIEWNFFATSHGKGPVDGIGGSAKRFVWDKVRTRKHTVTDAKTFAEAASTMKNVSVCEITSSEITKRNGKLNLNVVFSEAKAIPGIAKMHFFTVVNDEVAAYVLSSDKHDEETQSSSETIAAVGDWFIVEYDGKQFPGEVLAVRDGEFQVSVMGRVGKYWKWPSTRDAIFYMRHQMIAPLDAPEVVNNRGHFKFSAPI
ncbi:uncharacterized protein [Diadema setosum]|uniref:uncharacterized protein n=1 Tax=Diadema setosum TaxID=31175 RepID=UPI003B3B71FB